MGEPAPPLWETRESDDNCTLGQTQERPEGGQAVKEDSGGREVERGGERWGIEGGRRGRRPAPGGRGVERGGIERGRRPLGIE